MDECRERGEHQRNGPRTTGILGGRNLSAIRVADTRPGRQIVLLARFLKTQVLQCGTKEQPAVQSDVWVEIALPREKSQAKCAQPHGAFIRRGYYLS